jgi:hypothetical protein
MPIAGAAGGTMQLDPSPPEELGGIVEAVEQVGRKARLHRFGPAQ